MIDNITFYIFLRRLILLLFNTKGNIPIHIFFRLPQNKVYPYPRQKNYVKVDFYNVFVFSSIFDYTLIIIKMCSHFIGS